MAAKFAKCNGYFMFFESVRGDRQMVIRYYFPYLYSELGGEKKVVAKFLAGYVGFLEPFRS